MTPENRTSGGPRPGGASEIKDPVCGMNVNPGSAVRHEHGGKTYYFCSAHCLSKFRAEPGKYTQA